MTSGDKESVSPISRAQSFHVIIDHTHRTFSMDAPEGASGVRLHYEMLVVARKQNKKLHDFDIRAETHEAALAEMQALLPDHAFLGTWAEGRDK
jgi:hypothetical protein